MAAGQPGPDNVRANPVGAQGRRPQRTGDSVRPPNPPWISIEQDRPERAALAFYYSDPQSRLPVREVTRPHDNKADPNLETLTFGLFTTCEPGMRRRVVEERMRHLFFCTNRGGIRVLAGYYEVGWYCKGPPIKGYRPQGEPPDDYALAASKARFVNPGFPLRDLTGYLHGQMLNTRFRTHRYVDRLVTGLLLELLDETPDATREYLREIRRLESLNIKKYGYRYENWRRPEGFNWDAARIYLGGNQ